MQIQRPSVLVVDDDFDICALVIDVLSDEGFFVTATLDLTALKELASRLDPDVVLLNVKGFGDEVAWDAANWLQRQAKPIPVIIFTTHPCLAQAQGVGANGQRFTNVIQKPFDLQELVVKVRAAVADRHPRSRPSHEAQAAECDCRGRL